DGRTVEKRDEEGAIVVTRYQPDVLRMTAEVAGGTFIAAEETDKATRVRPALQSQQGPGHTVQAGRTGTPRFQLFLLPAVLLLLLDLWRTERRGRRAPAAAAATTAAALLAVQACALPGGLARQAAADYDAGRYDRAARAFRAAIDDGDLRPE